MTPTFEQAIEIVKALPQPEREKVRDWIDEHKSQTRDESDEKFRLALKWIDEHRVEYDGQLVVLDGDQLIAHGTDAKALYAEARARGIESPFVERVKAKVLPFGGW